MEILTAIILGIVQGITEWLPVSSEGIISWILLRFYGSTLSDAIAMALWLHLGTLLAAIIYFRHDIKKLLKELPQFKSASKDLHFLVFATITSALVGGALYFWFLKTTTLDGRWAMVLISGLLIVTGIIQLGAKKTTGTATPSKKEGLIVGALQGLALLPGISRSGITTGYLLLRNFNAASALRLSFLMSIPAVLMAIGIIILDGFVFSFAAFIAVLFAAVFGYLTIALFIKLAEKINFAYFCFFLAFLVLVSFLV